MNKNEILDLLYDVRINDVAVASPSEKKIMKKSMIARDDFQKLIDEKINDDELKNKFSDCLENLDECFGDELGYLSEKYYKAGFVDSVSLIFNSLEQKKSMGE